MSLKRPNDGDQLQDEYEEIFSANWEGKRGKRMKVAISGRRQKLRTISACRRLGNRGLQLGYKSLGIHLCFPLGFQLTASALGATLIVSLWRRKERH